jgi:4-amino-4-deoxy-L-arabinose transferase-like glycosyltransferase
MSIPRARAFLALIFLIYLVLGVLFAVYTPHWQAPDEPAHYNYIRYLVENGRFPVLQMGDYPHEYMEEIKGRRFPPDLSIAPIRYEFHQPPLYYSLAAPIYVLAKGALLPLRLLSVALGAGVVALAYATGRRIYPAWPALALAAAAFVAFLPQHLATVSQAGNDVLAELLFALVLFQLVGWLQEPSAISHQPSAVSDQPHPESTLSAVNEPQSAIKKPQSAIILGFLLGLILITKTTAFIAVPLALGVLIWRWLRDRAPARRVLTDLALVAIPAAVIALPWFSRNVAIYGWPDFLGLRRHDAVVVGQLRLTEYLAQFGAASYLRRLVEFTFKSFWGVFGWQGVFMDSRIYLALAILCALSAAGLALRVAHSVARSHASSNDARNTQDTARSAPSAIPQGHDIRNPQYPKGTLSAIRNSLWLLAATVLLALLVYAGYNLQFVQHQGRYLFTALIPIAVFFALGWDEALQPRSSLLLALGLVLAGIILAFWGVIIGPGLPKWSLALLLAFAAVMALAGSIRPGLAGRRPGPGNQQSTTPNGHAVRNFLFLLPYALLPLLSLYAVFGAIVPQLAR